MVSKRTLSNSTLLQIAEMKSLCKWGQERLKDIHFKFTTLLDIGTDAEIKEYAIKMQPFFMLFKEISDDSENFLGASTHRVLQFYKKKNLIGQVNELDELFKKEGSKLDNHIF